MLSSRDLSARLTSNIGYVRSIPPTWILDSPTSVKAASCYPLAHQTLDTRQELHASTERKWKSIVSEKNTAAVKDKNLKGKVKDQDNIQARIISQKSKNYRINYIFSD